MLCLGRFEDLLKDTQSEVSTVHSQVSTVHSQVSAIRPQVSDTCSEVSTDDQINNLEPVAKLFRKKVNSGCNLNLTLSTYPTIDDRITPSANIFMNKDRFDPLKHIPKLTTNKCE